MKIYFAGSITGGRQDSEVYQKIIKLLSIQGQVLTEHIWDGSISNQGEQLEPEQIFERDVAWLAMADVVVAEVSTPSLGVGYELGLAEKLKKRVICLFNPSSQKTLSAMIVGNEKFEVHEYGNLDDVAKILLEVFEQ